MKSHILKEHLHQVGLGVIQLQSRLITVVKGLLSDTAAGETEELL